MEVFSKLVEIPKNNCPTTEYIESELGKYGFSAIRWAVVEVKENSYIISAAVLKN